MDTISPERQDDPPAKTRPGRLAALLGNASLTGLGYILLRRRRAAVAALVGSLVLLGLIAVWPGASAWRLLLLAWWAAMLIHTLVVTSGTPSHRRLDRRERPLLWRNRLLAWLVLLLVAFSWFRFDAWTIAREAEAAQVGGDCDRAVASLRWLGLGHRLADDAVAARGEKQREACELLLAAVEDTDLESTVETLEEYLAHPGALWDGAGPMRAGLLLDLALDEEAGLNSAMLEAGFAQLEATLREAPAETGRVQEVSASFLSELDEAEPCDGRAVDEWLLARTWNAPELAEVVAPEAERLPERMYQCAYDTEFADTEEAGRAYQEFVGRYPEHDLVDDAVRRMFESGLYCDFPVAYAGAPAYEGAGPHPMRMFDFLPSDYGFPDSWLTATVDETVLVVCVEGPERGAYQETCAYEPGANQILAPFQDYVDVDFYATRFAVKAYELHTGELVADYAEEIGDPCPEELEYDYYYALGDSVPSEYDSTYTDADVRSVFERLQD